MTVLKCCPKNVSAKTLVRNVRSEVLGKKASERATIKNDRTEKLPKNVSAKTVVQNFRIEMLAEKSFERTNIKNDGTKMLSKKCIRKNSHSKCPYRNASWKTVRENYQ